MINKFQQGGILAQLQQLPKEQQQQIMQAFAQWAQQRGVDLNQLQQDPNALEQALGQFMQEMQSQQAQIARHGAKLNYIKSLKHQCAEDEELVYYKRGGSVDCGCKKKMETGGKTPKKRSPVENFKNRKQDQATKDSIEANVHNNQDIQTNVSEKTPGDYKKNKQGKMQWTPDRTKAPYKKEKGGDIKKDCGGVKLKKGDKVKSAGAGCIAKFKQAYRQGGIL